MADAIPVPRPVRDYSQTVYGARKMKLAGESWTGDWKNKPSLEIDIVANNPRFVCWSQNPAEEGMKNDRGQNIKNMPINATMGPFDLMRLLNWFDKVIESPEVTSFTMDFNGPKYDSNNKPVYGEKEAISKITIGRSADGIIFMQLAAKGRDKPTFLFKENEWVTLTYNGEELSPVETSSDEARSVVAAWRIMFGPILAAYAIPEKILRQERLDREEPAKKQTTISDAADTDGSW